MYWIPMIIGSVKMTQWTGNLHAMIIPISSGER